MPVDLPPRIIEVFEKLAAAHALLDVVNKRTEKLTAELKQLCPPRPGVTAEGDDEDRSERLLQAARTIMGDEV